jgi:aldehyde dehydrogenase
LFPVHSRQRRLQGVGRENHKMMLDDYQQTKNLLVSYDINPLGFF